MKLSIRFEPGKWRLAAVGTSVAVAAVLSGCGEGGAPGKRVDRVEMIPQAAKEGIQNVSFLQFEVPPRPQKSAEEMLAQGKRVYEQNCAICHGVTGDGKGDAAQFLVPRPRSFVVAVFAPRRSAVFRPTRTCFDRSRWECPALRCRRGTIF